MGCSQLFQMGSWVLLGLGLLTIPELALAKVTKLSAPDREGFEHPAKIEMLRAVRQVPGDIMRACASVARSREFRLADPGEPFQVSDALTEQTRNLPRRRLIWAARIPRYYVIHYESGGYAHSYHVLLVAVGEPNVPPQVVWSAAAIHLRSYDEFLSALRKGTLDDQLDYYP